MSPSKASPICRLGFLAGQIAVPDDFDRMGADGIEQVFSGQTEPTND